MTDRELLELASKAAGMDCWWSGDSYAYAYEGNLNVPIPWDPLIDDGGAISVGRRSRKKTLLCRRRPVIGRA